MVDDLSKLVRTTLSMYDKNHLEARYGYKLHIKKGQSYIVPEFYNVSTYLMIPEKFGLDEDSFSAAMFYKNVTSFLFFRIPKLSYKEMLGMKNRERSPLVRIKKVLSGLSGRYPSKLEQEKLIQEARVFGCGFHQFCNKKTNQILFAFKKIHNSSCSQGEDELQKSVDETKLKIEEILRALDECVAAIRAIAHPKMTKEFEETMDFCYISIFEACVNLVKSASAKQEVVYLKVLADRLKPLFDGVKDYGNTKKLWLDEHSEANQISDYLSYRSYLKRKTWSAYYLETRKKSSFRIKQQSGAMLAAAFAGAFAIAAEIYIRTTGFIVRSASYRDIINLFIVIGVFTVAYILKDRIKEIGRGKWKQGIFRRLPDQSNDVVFRDPAAGVKSQIVGYHDEVVEHIDPEAVPKSILSALELDDEGFFDKSHFNIIKYNKRLWLKRDKIKLLKRKLRMVFDLTRISLSPILNSLPEPEGNYFITDANMRIVKRPYPRTQKINIAINVRSSLSNNLDVSHDIYQVTVDQGGIKSVRRILPSGER